VDTGAAKQGTGDALLVLQDLLWDKGAFAPI
jgi:hypothetical protein